MSKTLGDKALFTTRKKRVAPRFPDGNWGNRRCGEGQGGGKMKEEDKERLEGWLPPAPNRAGGRRVKGFEVWGHFLGSGI